MRFSILASLSLAALPLVASRSSAQQPLQVYLYPSPSSSSVSSGSANGQAKDTPTLSADQAKAVLSHHLGEGVGDFEEIPNDESMWAHLMGMWTSGSANLQGSEKPRIVVLDGGVSPQDVLPTSLPSPAFYLEDDDSTDFLLQPYMNQAKNLLAHILDSMPEFTKSFKDVFQMAGTTASILGHELSCLTALADSIPWINHGSYPWEAITISGFNDVSRGEEVWETGRQGVKAGLESMTTPDSPPLLLIIRPSSSISKRQNTPRALTSNLQNQKRANTTLAQSCYPSEQECTESTECNGRGACSLKGKGSNGECWGCKCKNGFAGVECQKDDYSTPFIILVFSTFLLVALGVGSIALLASIGDTKLPSTLTLAIGGTMKHD